jgi:hypothetical protein
MKGSNGVSVALDAMRRLLGESDMLAYLAIIEEKGQIW